MWRIYRKQIDAHLTRNKTEQEYNVENDGDVKTFDSVDLCCNRNNRVFDVLFY